MAMKSHKLQAFIVYIIAIFYSPVLETVFVTLYYSYLKLCKFSKLF